MQVARPLVQFMWRFGKQPPAPAGETLQAKADTAPEPVTAGEVIEAAPEPALLLDAQAVVRHANPAARELFDIDPRGRHLSAALRAPAVLEAVAAALNGASPRSVDYEQRVPVRRGFSVHVAALGPGRGALVVLRDLTREQQVERMRADFVANASHELRTPLTALSGFLDTVQGAAKDDPKAQAKFLGLMRSQADRMRRLIDDLLSLSRIEMNEHVRPSEEVDLAQVAAHVCEMLAGLAQQAGAELKLSGPRTLMVAGSRDELVQVVQNLVENAIKYGGMGKPVEVGLGSSGGFAELSVRDHGPGIAREHLPRLTERFYRVNVQESRSRGGTGLGLAIVKHIVNRHRGKLLIRSELGAGSSFTVRVPLKN
jgi:two-component system phosphate regulon sensor histidine kinase PhoR